MWRIILLIYFLILVSCQDHIKKDGDHYGNGEPNNREGGLLGQLGSSHPGRAAGDLATKLEKVENRVQDKSASSFDADKPHVQKSRGNKSDSQFGRGQRQKIKSKVGKGRKDKKGNFNSQPRRGRQDKFGDSHPGKGRGRQGKFGDSHPGRGRQEKFGDSHPGKGRGRQEKFGNSHPGKGRGQGKFGDSHPGKGRGRSIKLGDSHPGKGRGRQDKFGDSHPGKGRGRSKKFGDSLPGKGRGRQDKFGDSHPGKGRGQGKFSDFRSAKGKSIQQNSKGHRLGGYKEPENTSVDQIALHSVLGIPAKTSRNERIAKNTSKHGWKVRKHGVRGRKKNGLQRNRS